MHNQHIVLDDIMLYNHNNIPHYYKSFCAAETLLTHIECAIVVAKQ